MAYLTLCPQCSAPLEVDWSRVLPGSGDLRFFKACDYCDHGKPSPAPTYYASAWLKSDNLIGPFGTPVEVWQDLSGNGNDLVRPVTQEEVAALEKTVNGFRLHDYERPIVMKTMDALLSALKRAVRS